MAWRFILVALLCLSGPTAIASDRAAALNTVLGDAEALTQLETVIVAHEGDIVSERGYRGNSVTAPTNIKSASKSVVSALVGIAIDQGHLEGPDQRQSARFEVSTSRRQAVFSPSTRKCLPRRAGCGEQTSVLRKAYAFQE